MRVETRQKLESEKMPRNIDKKAAQDFHSISENWKEKNQSVTVTFAGSFTFYLFYGASLQVYCD